MNFFPKTLRDAAEALDVMAAPKARTLKLISPTEAMVTPPITGKSVRYTGHGIADPVKKESPAVKRGSAAFTTYNKFGRVPRQGQASKTYSCFLFSMLESNRLDPRSEDTNLHRYHPSVDIHTV